MKKYILGISLVLISVCLLTIIFNFNPNVVGLALMAVVVLFYILYINPKYMNRLFGKKQKNNVS